MIFIKLKFKYQQP